LNYAYYCSPIDFPYGGCNTYCTWLLPALLTHHSSNNVLTTQHHNNKYFTSSSTAYSPQQQQRINHSTPQQKILEVFQHCILTTAATMYSPLNTTTANT
jgi:hypothetical protein